MQGQTLVKDLAKQCSDKALGCPHFLHNCSAMLGQLFNHVNLGKHMLVKSWLLKTHSGEKSHIVTQVKVTQVKVTLLTSATLVSHH